MRIAYITNAASFHCYKWVSYFANKNKISLICFEGQGKPLLYEKIKNIKIYPILPHSYPLLKFWKRKKTLNQLRNIIRGDSIQIIHSIYIVPNSFWGYHLNFKNHITTTYGSDILIDYNETFKNPKNIKEKINYYQFKKLVENSLNNAKFVTSTSTNQQEVIKQFIRDNKKLAITRTGVDVANFTKNYNTLIKQTEEKIILSNRALRPLYNIHIIIDAFNLLKKNKSAKGVRLAIIKVATNRAYLKEIIQQIKNYNLENDIIWIDEKKGVELIQVYKNADIIIMIPSSDGTPVSAIETMLAKKPLLIGSLDYDKDLFNEDTIWKTNSFSPENISKKLLEILQESETILNIKTKNAYASAIQYGDTNKEVRKIEELYKIMTKTN
jgi:glycosyltransferase involved in cell wall biosynthesis